MALNIKDNPALVTSGLALKMGVNNDLGIDIVSSLALNTPVGLEDLLYFKNGSDVIFKGVVQTLDHNLDDEGVDSSCIGVEQYINSQEWVPVNRFYNDTETTSGVSINDATIAQFIALEFVDDVTNWINSIVIDGNDIGNLIIPRLDLKNIGFMDALESIVRLYPYLRWTIEYTHENNIFPCGNIIIFSALDGRDTHTLAVGGEVGLVTSLNVTHSATDTAKYVEIHARGKFTERFEVLQPFWSTDEELIPEFYGRTPMPSAAGGTVSLPSGHDFPQDVTLFADNVDAEYLSGSRIEQSIKLFAGSDYTLDMESGTVRFIEPEGDDPWIWVDSSTGERASGDFANFGGVGVGIANARRPIAFGNSHINDDGRLVKQLKAFYHRPSDNAYKQYRSKYPIADFRLRKEVDDTAGTNPETATSGVVFRKESESLSIYTPNIATASEAEDLEEDPRSSAEIANQTMNPDWVADETPDDQWYRSDGRGNGDIRAGTLGFLSSLGGTEITAEEIQRYFTKVQGSASFEEGETLVTLSERQLAAHPRIYEGEESDSERKSDSLGTVLAGDSNRIARSIWTTWPVVAHYTSWEACIEERVTSFGGERRYTGIIDSTFQYLDNTGFSILGTPDTLPPYEVFDNTGVGSTHEKIADEAQDYFGTPYWTGNISVAILRVGETDENPSSTADWDIPYKIGDICLLSGEISVALRTDFRGLIVAINYDKLSEGIVELEFGRREPRTNPFLPRTDLPLNIEGDNLTGTGTAGMRGLGGSQ